jgi:hypothetical protein
MKRLLSILFAATLMATVLAVPATAQKKSPPKKEVAPPPQRQTGIKEILSQYIGKMTTLGTLKKVESDYFVFEEDGNTSYHPLSTLHTIKLVKDPDTGEITIEIGLVDKD